MENGTKTLDLVSNFIRKLIEDTVNRRINWLTTTANQLNEFNPNKYANLLSFEPLMFEADNKPSKFKINSKTFGLDNFFEGNSFNFMMPNGTEVILISICDLTGSNRTLELWVSNEDDRPQCVGLNNSAIRNEALIDLYNAVYNYSIQENLELCYQEEIEQYLAKDASYDNNYSDSYIANDNGAQYYGDYCENYVDYSDNFDTNLQY